jgi:hypothetical protein
MTRRRSVAVSRGRLAATLTRKRSPVQTKVRGGLSPGAVALSTPEPSGTLSPWLTVLWQSPTSAVRPLARRLHS